MIYHIADTDSWDKFKDKTHYEADSLHTEGFIHCCSSEIQLREVLERFYNNMQNLLILHIDEKQLDCELKYEPAPDTNERYPHIFGAIIKTAIVSVLAMKTNEVNTK
jgi:uncharacterized protein (DUF952 family)